MSSAPAVVRRTTAMSVKPDVVLWPASSRRPLASSVTASMTTSLPTLVRNLPPLAKVVSNAPVLV
ncbi:hypothetical protein LRS14_06365 [Aquincola sp. J276]|nr:hypothetical protein [Aquincola sp. J276]MCR5864878.1 hypothetical protein [Aquincola sp. J276]